MLLLKRIHGRLPVVAYSSPMGMVNPSNTSPMDRNLFVVRRPTLNRLTTDEQA